MDPLSIVASSLTIAQVVLASLETYTKVLRAKPELIAVHNEVADLLIVLSSLADSLSSQAGLGVQFPPTADILQTLLKIIQKLEQLSKDVGEWVVPASNNLNTKILPQWKRLGVVYYARRYKDELRSLRLSLTNSLAVVGLLSTSRIELSLQQVLLYAQQGDDRGKDIISLLRQPPQPEARDQVSSVNTAEQTVCDITNAVTIDSSLKASRVLFDSKQLTAISAVGIRTAQFPRTVCTPWCSCICHSERRIGTPKALQWLVGSLLIGYSGLPILSRDCNEQSCHLRAQPTSYITYYFPPWFLSRMVSILLTVTPIAGPVISLKTQRTVPSSADILTYAKSGDLEKIELLFEQGLASPHDVDYASGVTALHLAISHKRIDVCRYLLKMNADPFLEDRTAWAAADNAWDKILTGTFPAEIENALRLLFPEAECIERREFGMLHKIVLGLNPTDLSRYLTDRDVDVNAVDSNGRTALSLAAERSDITSLNILLAHGSDLELANNSGVRPIHFAACAKDPTILRALLKSGAIVDSVTDWDQTALIYAAAYTPDAQHAMILLDAGAQIDFRDRDGMTALSWVAIADNRAVAAELIRRNANLRNIDKNGDTVVTLCITMQRLEILDELKSTIAASTGTLAVPSPAKSVFRVAAGTGSLGVLRMLTSFDSWRINFSLSAHTAATLREVLEQRSDYTPELGAAFDALLASVLSEEDSSIQENAGETSLEEQYVDALDYID